MVGIRLLFLLCIFALSSYGMYIIYSHFPTLQRFIFLLSFFLTISNLLKKKKKKLIMQRRDWKTCPSNHLFWSSNLCKKCLYLDQRYWKCEKIRSCSLNLFSELLLWNYQCLCCCIYLVRLFWIWISFSFSFSKGF